VSFRAVDPFLGDVTTGAKRNLGLLLASGDYVASFDDDDLYAPVYLERMIGQMERDHGDLITLSSWYNFDVATGRFGACDSREAGSNKTMLSWVWGYGFSYVHRLEPALEGRILYANRTMGEDYEFFTALKKFCGEFRAVVLDDYEGICLHTLHKTSTSSSFSYAEIHREDVQDLMIAELPSALSRLLDKYPRHNIATRFIKNRKGCTLRRGQGIKLHCTQGEFELSFSSCATGRELKHYCATLLGEPWETLEFHRCPPPLNQSADMPRQLTASLRRAIGNDERVGPRQSELWLADLFSAAPT